MSEFLKKLEAFGADVPATMERYDNDEELYKSCLRVFFEDEKIQQLKDEVNKGDYDKVSEYVHSVKGLMINLGLVPFISVLEGMELDLKAENYSELKLHTKGFYSLLQSFVEMLG